MKQRLISLGGIIMRFREFREVERNIEREKLTKDEEEGYKKIKPETDITFEEAKRFVESLFV